MRQAYNSGNYAKARHHARKILHVPKEENLARSVIIRSHWNEEHFEDIVNLLREWNDPNLEEYLQKSIDQLFILRDRGQKVNLSLEGLQSKRYTHLQEQQPIPVNQIHWDPNEIGNNFSQEGARVWFRFPEGYCYWDMPEDYELNQTHRSLLELVAELLLSPWLPETKIVSTSSRKKGHNPSLSFSAGTDSTATFLVMPENTVLGYHKRSFESKLKHDNPKLLIQYLQEKRNTEVVSIPSNHELIRTFHNKSLGFSTDLACASHLVLLGDYFDLGGIAFGTPLDNTWLWKGRVFRLFESSKYFEYWSSRFLHAGLELILPIAGISEAGTMKICEQSDLMPYLNSCSRGDGEHGCGGCWKCFHKNGPLGRNYDIEAREIQQFLHRVPLPTAIHALWAIQTMGLRNKVPDHLHAFLENDFSWWTKVYPPSKEIISLEWREQIWRKICTYLEIMDPPYEVEQVNLYGETLD